MEEVTNQEFHMGIKGHGLIKVRRNCQIAPCLNPFVGIHRIAVVYIVIV